MNGGCERAFATILRIEGFVSGRSDLPRRAPPLRTSERHSTPDRRKNPSLARNDRVCFGVGYDSSANHPPRRPRREPALARVEVLPEEAVRPIGGNPKQAR